MGIVFLLFVTVLVNGLEADARDEASMESIVQLVDGS